MTRPSVVAFVLAALAADAHAQPTPDAAARVLFSDAIKAYNNNDFARAAAKFEAAYEINGDARLEFDAGQAYRKANDCGNAASAFRRYLAAEPKAPNREQVQGFIAEMDACVDAAKPPPAPLVAPPVPVVKAAPALDVPVQLAAPPRDRKRERIVGLAVGGAGLVAIGIGAVLTHDVGLVTADRAALCAHGCVWQQVEGQAAALDARGNRDEVAEIVAYALGGVMLAGGTALYFHARRHEVVVTGAPASSGIGGSVQASWRF